VAGLYLVAGHQPLTPHWERYAMFLTVPSCAAAAVLLAATGTSLPALRRQGLTACAVSAALLAGTFLYYVRPVWTGAESHRAFRTGPVEPKLAAFEWIDQAAGANGPVTVVAEDWWCYQPLRYLAGGRDNWQVVTAGAPTDVPRGHGPVFLVGFAGGEFEQRFGTDTGKGDMEAPWVARDNAGRAVLLVWRRRGPGG
jgi:hypothetical protein